MKRIKLKKMVCLGILDARLSLSTIALSNCYFSEFSSWLVFWLQRSSCCHLATLLNHIYIFVFPVGAGVFLCWGSSLVWALVVATITEMCSSRANTLERNSNKALTIAVVETKTRWSMWTNTGTCSIRQDEACEQALAHLFSIIHG